MVKYKTDRDFKGLKEKKVFKANEPFEMTIERANEVRKNIKEKYDIDINFERVDKQESAADDDKGE